MGNVGANLPGLELQVLVDKGLDLLRGSLGVLGQGFTLQGGNERRGVEKLLLLEVDLFLDFMLLFVLSKLLVIIGGKPSLEVGHKDKDKGLLINFFKIIEKREFLSVFRLFSFDRGEIKGVFLGREC